MLYQVFLEQMPYCVEYHNETNSIVVKNRDYQPIYEGLVLSDLDCKSAFRSFACPLDDCFRENTEYLQCYLYDDNKEPVFKKGGVSFYENRMDKYLERKERLWQFLVDNVRATKPTFMH
jgi:hypothetical protein